MAFLLAAYFSSFFVSFDTLAPFYRGLEALIAGNVLHRCRTSHLAEARISRKALLLGEGPGRFLVELLRENPNIDVTCVEASPGMIAEARARVSESDRARVHFERADALHWQQPPDARFDLVATHFFLDCFREDELQKVVQKIGACATGDARWLVSDFRIPESGWQNFRARLAVSLMYRCFRIVTGISASRLTPPGPFLRENGFELAARRLGNFGLVYADLWVRR